MDDRSLKTIQGLRAYCGQKHGNSITTRKKDGGRRWKPRSKEELMLELKNAAMLRSKMDARIPVDAPTVVLLGGSKKGVAALFSKQRSAASSTDSVLASSTATSSQRVAQPLADSEISVVASQDPADKPLPVSKMKIGLRPRRRHSAAI